MANYLLLYVGGDMSAPPASEEEQQKVLQAWNEWFGTLGSALVDGGNPISPMAKNIAPGGAVSDAAAGPMASGYSVIQAESLDEAVGMAKGCPVLQDGVSITVYETVATPGM